MIVVVSLTDVFLKTILLNGNIVSNLAIIVCAVIGIHCSQDQNSIQIFPPCFKFSFENECAIVGIEEKLYLVVDMELLR